MQQLRGQEFKEILPAAALTLVSRAEFLWSLERQEQELSSCWDVQQFGHNSHGPKLGGLLRPFLWGDLGRHLTQCHLGVGLPLYWVASWSIQLFGHNTPTLQTGQWSHTIGRTITCNGRPKSIDLLGFHWYYTSKSFRAQIFITKGA